MTKAKTIVHGWDLALNHAGFVELTDGVMTDFQYVTDLAASAGRSKEHGIRLPLFKSKDRQQRAMERLAWWEHFIDKKLLIARQPNYVGIEDYALDASHGAHYKGELGGIARILCWFRGISFRLHDPISIKMFTTHDGTVRTKDEVERKVLKRWKQDFSKFNQPLAKPKTTGKHAGKQPKENRTTSEDLADAYAIAMLVWTEVLLRRGELKMSILHEKEVRVFNRVTKSYPVNLLDREWLTNPDGGTKTPHGEPVCSKCGSRRCCLAKDSGATTTANLCSVCSEPQFDTPSGATCKNGHGGAPAKEGD